MNIITEYIIKHKYSFMNEVQLLNELEVNCGSCVDFAEFIEYKLNSNGYKNLIRVCNDSLIDYEKDILMNCTNIDYFYQPSLDEYSITNEQYKEYRKKLCDANTVSVGFHMWIYCYETKKHYDIECAEGVINVFELPFFKRQYELL